MKNPKTFLFLRIFFLNFPKKKIEKIWKKKFRFFFEKKFKEKKNLGFFLNFFYIFVLAAKMPGEWSKNYLNPSTGTDFSKCPYAGSLCPPTPCNPI